MWSILLVRGKMVVIQLIVLLGLVSFFVKAVPPNMKHTRPNVTILCLWSSTGNYAYGYSPDVMIYHKAANQLAKYQSDHSWPFYANYEVVDWQSNLTYLFQFMKQRLNRTLSHTLPPISVILGAEGNAGYQSAPIANTFGMFDSLL